MTSLSPASCLQGTRSAPRQRVAAVTSQAFAQGKREGLMTSRDQDETRPPAIGAIRLKAGPNRPAVCSLSTAPASTCLVDVRAFSFAHVFSCCSREVRFLRLFFSVFNHPPSFLSPPYSIPSSVLVSFSISQR